MQNGFHFDLCCALIAGLQLDLPDLGLRVHIEPHKQTRAQMNTDNEYVVVVVVDCNARVEGEQLSERNSQPFELVIQFEWF